MLTVNLRMRLLPESATKKDLLASTTTPKGELKEAGLSENKEYKVPASVETTPPGATCLMRLASAINKLPPASTATPTGLLNEAAVPMPSARATEPPPASVLTTPPGVILRRRPLPASATKTLPPESTATPEGLFKEAAAPLPSANALFRFPASVLTTPPGVILRRQWLYVSAT